MDNIGREHIDINTLRLLYNGYKAFFVPFLVIVVVIGVFIKVSVPAIQDLLKGYEEQKSTRLALENMQNKLNLLRILDGPSLESQFRVVSKALPVDKDFDSILNAISDASNKSGVALGGFRFVVGSLSKEEVIVEYPTLNVDVSIVGNVKSVDKFIGQLVKLLPLSEVVKISQQLDTSTITISFYYRPLKEFTINDDIPLGQITEKGSSLISEMSSLVSQAPTIDSLPVSTPSANPFF